MDNGGEVAVLPVQEPPKSAYNFAFQDFLKREYQYGLNPDRPICDAYVQGGCPLGKACPDRHNVSNSFQSSLVCKHWLRGLCKKGDQCEFLHEYNLRKMPECNYWSRYGTCSNGDDCLYQHPDPDSKRPPCPHFDRGFCPLGSRCADKHVKKEKICPFYLAGFCPDGPNCKAGAHAKFAFWDDMTAPKYKVIKSKEELEQERLEREAKKEEEEEKERERLGDSFVPGQQRFNKGGWRGGRRGGQKRQRKNF